MSFEERKQEVNEQELAATVLNENNEQLMDFFTALTEQKRDWPKEIKEARELAGVAESDLKRTKDAYEKKDFSDAIFRLQQSSEKMSKAFGTLFTGASYAEHKSGRVGHKTPIVFANMTQEKVLSNFILLVKSIRPDLKTDTKDLESLVNNHAKLQEIREVSFDQIQKLILICDKIGEGLQKNDMNNKFSQAIEIAKEFAKENGKDIDIASIEIVPITVNFIKLYIVGACSFPHENTSRYPDGKTKPQNYDENMGIVKAIPIFIEVIEKSAGNFRVLADLFEKIHLSRVNSENGIVKDGEVTL